MSLIGRVQAYPALQPHFGVAAARVQLPQIPRFGDSFERGKDCATRALTALGLGKGGTESVYPPSLDRTANHPETGRTLHLKQWGRRGEDVAEYPRKAPVILLVHGLGGRSEWQAPLAEKILDAQNRDSSPVLVYSINLPRVAKSDYGEGHVEDINDLVAEVREAIEYLKDHHESPVYAVGTSLGGLLLTDIAANNPETLAGVSLISPAYKPITTKGDKAKVVAARALNKLGLLNLVEGKIKRKDTVDQKKSKEEIPEGLSELQQQIWRESTATGTFDLTPHSYLQVLNLMTKARETLAKNIRIPVQVFATETDDTIDWEAIRDTSHTMPNLPWKDVNIYEEGEHNLVIDSKLGEMAELINERIAALLDESAKAA